MNSAQEIINAAKDAKDKLIQIDTSTQEGWEDVVKHRLAGGEVEEDGGLQQQWQGFYRHPSEFLDHHIYRIKQARVPAVGDVWEVKSGIIFWLVKECKVHHEDVFQSICYSVTGWIEGANVCPEHCVRYIGNIGTIDLSLLEGAGDE